MNRESQVVISPCTRNSPLNWPVPTGRSLRSTSARCSWGRVRNWPLATTLAERRLKVSRENFQHLYELLSLDSIAAVPLLCFTVSFFMLHQFGPVRTVSCIGSRSHAALSGRTGRVCTPALCHTLPIFTVLVC